MSQLWEGVREGCGACEFWWRFSTAQDLGTCKRYPPTMLSTMMRNELGVEYADVQQHLPTMGVSDWCGEFVRKGTRK